MSDDTDSQFEVIYLEGLTDYNEVWELQKRLNAQVIEGDVEKLIFTEHQPVITIGKSGEESNLITSREELSQLGYKIVESDRGGDITYHGPGQLVIYPILDLKRHYLDLHRYLRDLEQVAIEVLNTYNAFGFRVKGRTGVWTDIGKVAAIGVHVKKWVTMHGMAFNVSGELNGFNHIVPCGIFDADVTSLEKLTGMTLKPLDPTLTDQFTREFRKIFFDL